MRWLWVIEIASCLLALITTINVLGNLRAFRRLDTFAPPHADPPFVSVLVPARDEERSIIACIQSLIDQRYPAFEIIVLDDGSTDATAALVFEFAATHPCLRLIDGVALPAGWKGKSFACEQLSQHARGDILLFTDADTVHGPTMIASVVGAFADGAGVVTAFPEQITGSWGETLTIPYLLFTVWAFLPVGRVWTDSSPRIVAANGQLLAFTRDVYATIGGHAAVRDSVLDDMSLAQRAKTLGLRLRLVDGAGSVRTRMYRDVGEVWQGFSKNAFALMGHSMIGAVAISAVMILLYVVPLFVLEVTLWRDPGNRLAFPAVFLILAMLVQRCLVNYRIRQPLWTAVLHPISVVLSILILLNAIRWYRRGRVAWKGRIYATAHCADAVPDE